MKRGPFPVLREDGSRLDWHRAEYSVEAKIGAGFANIVHSLTNAVPLKNAINRGEARWAVEFRCSRTLTSRTEFSSRTRQEIRWNANEVRGKLFLIPGLVAKEQIEIETGELNEEVWPMSVVTVPAGWWLARGDVRRTTSLVASLVKFKRGGPELPEGQMRVEEDTDGSQPCFVVALSESLYDNRRVCRDVQIAGLIAACGRLPRSSLAKDGENEDHPLAQELRARLEAGGVSDWDTDEFDPAHAATTLEPFFAGGGESA